MASKWSREAVQALLKACDDLRDAVDNAVKAAYAYKDDVAVEGNGVLDEGANSIVELVEEGLKTAMLSGAESIENVAKAEKAILDATHSN